MLKIDWRQKMKSKTLSILLSFMLGFGYVAVMPTDSYAFSIYDDEDEDDREDVEELLSKAKKASNNQNFSYAYTLINEAKKMGVEYKSIEKTRRYIATQESDYNEELRLKREREEQARLAKIQAKEKYNKSGDKGGSLNCVKVSSNYALYRYCKTGSCDSLSGNYEVYRLCKDDEYSALAYGVYNYLKNGNPYGLSGYKAQQGAKQNSSNFSDRKRFIIYYLNGFVYKNYD